MNLWRWLTMKLFTQVQLPLQDRPVDNGSSLREAQAKLEETRRVGSEAALVAYEARALRRQNHFSARIETAMKRIADDS